MKLLYIAFFFFYIELTAQNIPKIGKTKELEIANWNLEWFGKTAAGFGPNNDALQQANVLQVLKYTDIDLWAFCEVCSIVAFDSMMQKLQNYDYKICNYSPEQKTAFIYKKNLFTFIDAQLLGTEQPDSFSTRRFPFSIRLKLNKDSFDIGLDTLQAIVLHLKANIGNDAEKLAAYNSRLRSANWLKMYLNQNKNKYITILGDWNDDLDESIYNSLPSPFAQLLNQQDYQFFSQRLTLNNESTTASYTNPIDHQLGTMYLASHWETDTCKRLKLEPYIANYSSSTSDHYPVYSRYNVRTLGLFNPLKFIFKLFPNPADNKIYIEGLNNFDYTIFNALGQKIVANKCIENTINTELLPNGIYTLMIEKNGLIFQKFFLVSHQ